MRFALQLKANLDNIMSFEPIREEFRWYLKLKCTDCHEETPNFVYFTEFDEENFAGRGVFNFVCKCKLCKHEMSVDVIKTSIKPYRSESSEKFQTIAEFECRGGEPTQFQPMLQWRAKSASSSTEFEPIDLKDNDWAEYDEKSTCTVGIYELQSQFVVASSHHK